MTGPRPAGLSDKNGSPPSSLSIAKTFAYILNQEIRNKSTMKYGTAPLQPLGAGGCALANLRNMRKAVSQDKGGHACPERSPGSRADRERPLFPEELKRVLPRCPTPFPPPGALRPDPSSRCCLSSQGSAFPSSQASCQDSLVPARPLARSPPASLADSPALPFLAIPAAGCRAQITQRWGENISTKQAVKVQ